MIKYPNINTFQTDDIVDNDDENSKATEQPMRMKEGSAIAKHWYARLTSDDSNACEEESSNASLNHRYLQRYYSNGFTH